MEEETKSKVDSVIQRIRAASGREFEVFIKDDPDLIGRADSQKNAVELSLTVVKQLNEDELAWLIAHEASHLTLEHDKRFSDSATDHFDRVEKNMDKVDRELKESGAGLIKRGFAAVVIGAVGVASGFVAGRAESRKYQNEADVNAVELVEKAGFDPEAGAEALKKIGGGYYPRESFLASLISTHPDSELRAESIKEIANKDKETR